MVHLALVFAACVDAIPPGDDGACARIKAHFGVDECGTVYQFLIPAQTPSGFTEFCVPGRLLDEAEYHYGPAEPTPRFHTFGVAVADCAYQCPSAVGCNSYRDEYTGLGGCFCPTGTD